MLLRTAARRSSSSRRYPRHALPELGGQFPLLLDAFEDGRTALLQLPKISEALLERAQLRIIEAVGGFFAITGDEGNGRAGIQQGDGRLDLLRFHGQLSSETGFDGEHLRRQGEIR
jgi:hypothetical protein